MRSYSYSDLVDALCTVGIDSGQCVMVHSSLLHLGRMEDVKSSKLAAMHYSALREVLGPEGTVVVPTFNFGFCDGEVFDPETTPSVGMGVFSEYVRKLPDAVRSTHPMQSIAAIGPQAQFICDEDTKTAFDPSGSFAKMLDLNARGLLLGTTMHYFSLIHLVEEQTKVPYRFMKTFTAPYGPNKDLKSYAMFARDLDIDPRVKFLKVDVIMRKRNLIKEVQLGMGKVQSFDVDRVYAITLAKLKNDPNWLIGNEI